MAVSSDLYTAVGQCFNSIWPHIQDSLFPVFLSQDVIAKVKDRSKLTKKLLSVLDNIMNVESDELIDKDKALRRLSLYYSLRHLRYFAGLTRHFASEFVAKDIRCLMLNTPRQLAQLITSLETLIQHENLELKSALENSLTLQTQFVGVMTEFRQKEELSELERSGRSRGSPAEVVA